MWQSLGFSQSPYDSNPLRAVQEDVDLLVGRDKEAIALYTVLESSRQGIYIISGTPGVGKTSFLNVHQYLMESGKSKFGPRILAARKLCPVQPNDKPLDIALRATRSVCESIQRFCDLYSKRLPDQTQKVADWLGHKPTSGYQIGLTILGWGGSIGRNVNIPSVNECSFEHIQDVLTCIVSEAVQTLNVDGVIIALDNIENLEEADLADTLITLRDTFFTIPNVWWILIGQSGLGSLIHTLNPRIAQRLSGTPLELMPISSMELHEAIEKRVNRFHGSEGGKAPLPSAIHTHLYDASSGELRFVLKYSESICLRVVQSARTRLVESDPKLDPSQVNSAMGTVLSRGIIPASIAQHWLKVIVKEEIKGLFLKPKEVQVLKSIAKTKGTRPRDYRKHSIKTMQDFSGNYLSKLHKQHLLVRHQEGRSVFYRLGGIAAIAAEYDLL
ncbi:MAG: hypothetical protein WBD36_16910 [Bacteroidota bacterium]